MTRVANFNPGPSALPLPALELARDELLDFEGSGMSILEHSHRGKVYEKVHAEALSLLRKLWAVPDSHDVLFLQGGASQQFAVVPMNLLPPGKSADYAITGTWAEKAFAEAKIVGAARAAADTRDERSPWNARGTQVRYDRVPAQSDLRLDPQAAYFHYTTNNTVMGTQYHYVPDTGAVPLVADMSSDILSYPLDVARFGLIYAGAQKNVGPTGITIVIVRKELVAAGRTDIPKIFRYATQAKENSLYNTIPTFGVYLVRNVLRWLDAQGGVAAIAEINRKKAALVYGAIDESGGFYTCPVEPGSRSVMNPVWYLPTAELDARFVSEAEKAGLVGLKGHRIVGGIRASLYNAVSLADTERLAGFLREFRARNG
jgi:phosphoserine aminotransferase